MQLIERDVVFLNVIPDLATGPGCQRAELKQFVTPVPSQDWNVRALFGLRASKRSDPQLIFDDVLTHGLNLADVAAHVWVVFPKHVAVRFSLLFD